MILKILGNFIATLGLIFVNPDSKTRLNPKMGLLQKICTVLVKNVSVFRFAENLFLSHPDIFELLFNLFTNYYKLFINFKNLEFGSFVQNIAVEGNLYFLERGLSLSTEFFLLAKCFRLRVYRSSKPNHISDTRYGCSKLADSVFERVY